MNDTLIEKIISEKIPCYFVSPHFDDAVLSCGKLLMELSGKTNVTVITVFSSAKEPSTLSAKVNLKQSGFNTADELYMMRARENDEVLCSIQAKCINLNYEDALWRKKKDIKLSRILHRFIPELGHVYPTYRFHINKGKIVKSDKLLMKKIADDITKLITDKRSLVFGPLGVGMHVDHIMTRDICERSFTNILYWSDFPYNVSASVDRTFVAQHNLKKHTLRSYLNKDALIRGYKTQFLGLFENGVIPEKEEVYYSE